MEGEGEERKEDRLVREVMRRAEVRRIGGVEKAKERSLCQSILREKEPRDDGQPRHSHNTHP